MQEVHRHNMQAYKIQKKFDVCQAMQSWPMQYIMQNAVEQLGAAEAC
jgi:hypothetical protein